MNSAKEKYKEALAKGMAKMKNVYLRFLFLQFESFYK